MNWAKGRKTRGRGASFKGALTYALHDKDQTTADRVGFVELRNLATDDPDRAWSEMMALCEAADDLKRRGGTKATGQKLAKPVYAFTLNWHEEDRPDAAHMRETALDALKTLGMDNLQAVIVDHTDRPHRHVHIIVNLVDPDTGKSVSLSNDEHKLDRWADNYEQAQGVIRSPDRRAKFEALDNDRTPPKRPAQASSREEWEASRGLDSPAAKERAAAIKAAYAAHVTQLKSTQSERYRVRRMDRDKLWNGYKTDSKAIRDRYKPFIDAIYKSRRNGPPHPYTEQALHDLQETAEWKQLGRRQYARRKTFNARERHFLGFVANIVSLHHAALKRGDQSSLLMLALSLRRRRASFEQGQDYEKQNLRQTQAERRKARADVLRASCRQELAERGAAYRKARKEMVARQASEVVADKAEWKKLAQEREKVWADFRKAFRTQPTQQTNEKSSQVRDQFNRVSAGDAPEANRDANGKGDQGRGDQGSQGRSRDDANVAPREASGGWKARRRAADRKADGSYRPRERSGKDRGGRDRDIKR